MLTDAQWTKMERPTTRIPDYFELRDFGLATLAGWRAFLEEVTAQRAADCLHPAAGEECTSIEEVCRFSSPSDSTLGSGAAKNRLNMLTHEMRGAGHDA